MNECALAPIRRAICCRAASDRVVAPATTLSNPPTNAKLANIKNAEEGRPNEESDHRRSSQPSLSEPSHSSLCRPPRSFWVPIVMEAKKDKNFKAVNPYAPKKAKASKKKR